MNTCEPVTHLKSYRLGYTDIFRNTQMSYSDNLYCHNKQNTLSINTTGNEHVLANLYKTRVSENALQSKLRRIQYLIEEYILLVCT